MSGHSKWAQIKRQKGLNDIKRGQTFTKLSNAITIAVKQGGGIADPEQNFRLRLAIDAARSANMPKENIERAIKRAMGKEAGDLSEIVYEGFAPFGVSVIVEAATDNPMRMTNEVKHVFTKKGGSFGQPGSVAYQFKQMGLITVAKENKSIDDTFEVAVNAGAEDIKEISDEVFIYTSFDNLAKVRKSLTDNDFVVIDASLARIPISPIEISDSNIPKIEEFINELESLDDVQKIYTNLV